MAVVLHGRWRRPPQPTVASLCAWRVGSDWARPVAFLHGVGKLSVGRLVFFFVWLCLEGQPLCVHPLLLVSPLALPPPYAACLCVLVLPAFPGIDETDAYKPSGMERKLGLIVARGTSVMTISPADGVGVLHENPFVSEGPEA